MNPKRVKIFFTHLKNVPGFLLLIFKLYKITTIGL